MTLSPIAVAARPALGVRPMRDTQRRKLIDAAIRQCETDSTSQIAKALDSHWRDLRKDLRRANFRKRVKKGLAGYEGYLLDLARPPLELLATGSLVGRQHAVSEALAKSINIDWPKWLAGLALLLRSTFTPIIERMFTIEQEYWLNRGGKLDVIDPAQVLDAYEARVGRQITNIADDTKAKVLSDITAWYNDPNQTFPDLLNTLQQYFSPKRAEAIARTGTVGIATQVTLNAMQQLGIKRFNVVLAPEDGPWPCQECIDQADANPHDIKDKKPPFHVKCRCGMSYVVRMEVDDDD